LYFFIVFDLLHKSKESSCPSSLHDSSKIIFSLIQEREEVEADCIAFPNPAAGQHPLFLHMWCRSERERVNEKLSQATFFSHPREKKGKLHMQWFPLAYAQVLHNAQLNHPHIYIIVNAGAYSKLHSDVHQIYVRILPQRLKIGLFNKIWYGLMSNHQLKKNSNSTQHPHNTPTKWKLNLKKISSIKIIDIEFKQNYANSSKFVI